MFFKSGRMRQEQRSLGKRCARIEMQQMASEIERTPDRGRATHRRIIDPSYESHVR